MTTDQENQLIISNYLRILGEEWIKSDEKLNLGEFLIQMGIPSIIDITRSELHEIFSSCKKYVKI
jgi:hypothetical protein